MPYYTHEPSQVQLYIDERLSESEKTRASLIDGFGKFLEARDCDERRDRIALALAGFYNMQGALLAATGQLDRGDFMAGMEASVGSCIDTVFGKAATLAKLVFVRAIMPSDVDMAVVERGEQQEQGAPAGATIQ